MRYSLPVPGLPITRRLLVIFLLIAGIVVASQVRVEARPPAPVPWSAVPVFESLEHGNWESAPLEAEITAAGISWTGRTPEAAWVRGSVDGVVWGNWLELDLSEDHAPDPGTSEAMAAKPASAPAYLGPVGFVQYRVAGADPDRVRAEGVETAGRAESLSDRVGRWVEGLTFSSEVADASPNQPTIIPRSAWGGDSCLPSEPEEPEYGEHLELAFVHHTYHAGSASNNYSEASVLDLVYSICSYHVNTRDWKDIGYNFLIDKYGNIYEGRSGGIDEVVWAAHTEGFNYYSTGIAFIGDHSSVAPTVAAQNAFKDLMAWKLDLHHVDPIGSVLIESLGGPIYEEGEYANLKRISGHRTAKLTSCPGWACYTLLDGLRPAIDQTGGAKIYGGWPLPHWVPGFAETGYEPIDLSLRFTQTTSWSLEVTDSVGTVVFSASGSGEAATVVWDGTSDGSAVPTGEYFVSVTGTVTGEDDPRPVYERFQMGDFVLPFSDDEDLVHEENIIAIADAEITLGCGDHVFCPEVRVTRGQMASFLARALDLPLSAFDHFSDDDTSVHQPAINSLADAGVTFGCGPRVYCPEDLVTRGQMAAFLHRSLPGITVSGTDYFADDDTHPAEAHINAIADAEITLGCSPTDFCPWSKVTRAQMASFLARAFLGAES